MIEANEERYVVRGKELERYLEGSSLGELLMVVFQGHGTNIVQVDAITKEELPANVLLDRSIELAKWLISIGIQVGDSVAINSENRLEFATVTMATFLTGATMAPLNPDYTPGELKHVVNLSKPKAVFCSPRTVKKMIQIKTQVPYLKHIVLFGPNKTSGDVVMLEDILKDAKGENIDESFIPPPLDPKEAVATILCSSGTTGLPKGVMCTHDNMTTYCDVMRVELPALAFPEHGNPDAVMGLPPFFHSMGFMIMFLNLLRGKLLVIINKFSVKVFLEAIIKYNIKKLAIPPPVFLAVLKHPITKNYDLSGIEEIRTGAAPMGKEMEQELKGRFKVNHVSQTYGMTETTLGVLVTPPDRTKVGSSGRVVAGMMAKIVDEEGHTLPAYQEGELCFKGPLVMKGYIGDEVATRETIDKDGWLHTGDVAYYDDEGYFFIVDRIKELIKYKAFQVAPAELEALLITHPQIQDAAVIGLPDEEAGELPLAYVVKRPDSTITEKDVEKLVADNVSPQKKLRGGVIFTDAIPRNPTGKILRRVLKQQALKRKSKL